MSKALTDDTLSQYRRDGYFFPHKILDDWQVADCREKLEKFESSQGKPIGGTQRNKSHLLFKWVDDLMRDPAILDPVGDLIGPNIHCWNTFFWIKETRPAAGASYPGIRTCDTGV